MAEDQTPQTRLDVTPQTKIDQPPTRQETTVDNALDNAEEDFVYTVPPYLNDKRYKVTRRVDRRRSGNKY